MSEAYITRTEEIARKDLALFPDVDSRFVRPQWHLLSPSEDNSKMPPQFYKAFLGDLTYEELINVHLPKYRNVLIKIKPHSERTYKCIEVGKNNEKWKEEATGLILNSQTYINLNEDLHFDRDKAYSLPTDSLRREWDAFLKNYGDQGNYKTLDDIFKSIKRFFEACEEFIPLSKYLLELETK